MANFSRPALLSMFIGDALAMPVHWYYNRALLDAHYGRVTTFVEPKKEHPDAIMSLHSTAGAGRGGKTGNVVGDVILKGKKDRWLQKGLHYHYGLHKGENTLNMRCALLLMREYGCKGASYQPTDFLQPYLDFMTGTDTHNDSYAESYHRQFFSRLSQGIPVGECAGEENHDSASIGGFINPTALALLMLKDGGDLVTIEAQTLKQMRLTHMSTKLEAHWRIFLPCLVRVFGCQDKGKFTSEIRAVLAPLKLDLEQLLTLEDRQIVVKVNLKEGGSATPATSTAAFPDFSFSHSNTKSAVEDDLEEALVANTNVGGDNCGRGAVLGALIAAAFGDRVLPPTLQDLYLKDEIHAVLKSI